MIKIERDMKKYIVMTTGYVHPYVSGEFDSFESAKAFAEAGNNVNQRNGNDVRFYVYELKQ